MIRIILAIVAFVVAGNILYSEMKFEDSPLRTKGTVVGYHVDDDKTKPIIKYSMNHQKIMTLHLDEWFSSREYAVGEVVSLRQNPDDLSDVKTHEYFGVWKYGFFALFLGMMLIPGMRSGGGDNGYHHFD